MKENEGDNYNSNNYNYYFLQAVFIILQAMNVIAECDKDCPTTIRTEPIVVVPQFPTCQYIHCLFGGCHRPTVRTARRLADELNGTQAFFIS